MSHVLVIDDEPRFCQATRETLHERGHEVTTVDSLAEARLALQTATPRLILLDLMLPDGNGLELLEQIDEHSPGRVVIITGHPGIKARIRGLVGHNVTYLTKPVDQREILRLVDGLDDEHEEPHYDEVGDSARHFGLLLGEAPAMQEVYRAIERFGPTDVTVLIHGESGTGKDLVARALHHVSGRRGRFVPTNCGGLTGELVASELFGHEKGSFTGATRRHAGVFERADAGTLFLDEVAEMRPEMQTYLLRTLEDGEIVRVGGEEQTRIDARLVAATNRNLPEALRDGSLREDLFYRLSECAIRLPPLRERGRDVELLVLSFVAELDERYGHSREVSREFLDRCRAHPWPGNVRELQHVVHRAYLLCGKGRIEARAFEAPIDLRANEDAGLWPGRAIRDVERELILKTLEHFGGDKKAAAETLGISLKTLYNRLSGYRSEGPSGSTVGDDRGT